MSLGARNILLAVGGVVAAGAVLAGVLLVDDGGEDPEAEDSAAPSSSGAEEEPATTSDAPGTTSDELTTTTDGQAATTDEPTTTTEGQATTTEGQATTTEGQATTTTATVSDPTATSTTQAPATTARRRPDTTAAPATTTTAGPATTTTAIVRATTTTTTRPGEQPLWKAEITWGYDFLNSEGGWKTGEFAVGSITDRTIDIDGSTVTLTSFVHGWHGLVWFGTDSEASAAALAGKWVVLELPDGEVKRQIPADAGTWSGVQLAPEPPIWTWPAVGTVVPVWLFENEPELAPAPDPPPTRAATRSLPGHTRVWSAEITWAQYPGAACCFGWSSGDNAEYSESAGSITDRVFEVDGTIVRMDVIVADVDNSVEVTGVDVHNPGPGLPDVLEDDFVLVLDLPDGVWRKNLEQILEQIEPGWYPHPGATVPVSIWRRNAPLPKVAVPDLTGTHLTEAHQRLRQAGLKLILHRVPTRNPRNDNVVSAQQPVAGTEVDQGSEVDIHFYDYGDSGTVYVPVLRGLTQQAAETNLRYLGLVPQVQPFTGGSCTAGQVNSVSPQSGTIVGVGTTITIHVCP